MSKFPLRKGGGAKGAGVVRQSRRARGRGSAIRDAMRWVKVSANHKTTPRAANAASPFD